MARFIGTKNRNQCQTHFTKLFGHNDINIDNLKTKYMIDDKTFNKFLNISRLNRRFQMKGQTTKLNFSNCG